MGRQKVLVPEIAACFLAVLIGLTAWGLDLEEAPQALLERMTTLVDGITTEGDFIVVGRVTFDGGASIEDCNDIVVNFYRSIDASLTVYPGGWYLSDFVIPAAYAVDARVVFRAFGYQPQDLVFTATESTVVLDEIVLVRNPDCAISGVVRDEHGVPLGGAQVCLTFPFSHTGCGQPRMVVSTDEMGQFDIFGLAQAEHALTTTAGGNHLTTWVQLQSQLPEALEALQITVFTKLQIVMDFVYQTNGSRSFEGTDIVGDTATWAVQTGGFDFEDGAVEDYDEEDLRDLELLQQTSFLLFDVFYQSGESGLYDAGEIPFESVLEAAIDGYEIDSIPCVVNHVYVVRTREGHYAKFVVRAIEPALEVI